MYSEIFCNCKLPGPRQPFEEWYPPLKCIQHVSSWSIFMPATSQMQLMIWNHLSNFHVQHPSRSLSFWSSTVPFFLTSTKADTVIAKILFRVQYLLK